jgi:hypothetical protein
MFRLHVKVQSLFLQKFFGAVLTFVRIHAGMFLQMIVHGVLALICRRTMGTYIESLHILLVSERDRGHAVRHFL